MQQATSPSFFLQLGSGSKKPKSAKSAHTTVINLDNTGGANDLVDVQFVYVQYGDTKILNTQLASKVKVGKTVQVALKAGTNPAAFFIMWKLGKTYDWMGDGSMGELVYEQIDATWRHEQLGVFDAQTFGYTGTGTSP